MFARFPYLTDSDETGPDAKRRRLDWHALLAKLDAERDLRNSLGDVHGLHGIAALMAEGSFDPRAAEMIFSLAAGAQVAGDMPERRFAAEDLSRLSQSASDEGSRLRNPKSSECNKHSGKADRTFHTDGGEMAPPATPTPRDGNARGRT